MRLVTLTLLSLIFVKAQFMTSLDYSVAFLNFRVNMIIDQWKKKATLYRSNTVFAPLGDDFRYDKTDEWDLQYVNYQAIFDYLKDHPELGVEVSYLRSFIFCETCFH